METNSNGDTSTEPKEFENFYIRQYVAEVRRKDWKKCCPFNLSGDSSESNHLAERVFASLILQDNDALVNTTENIEAPNSLKSFDVINLEVQAAVSETHTGVVIGNDAPINSIGNDAPITLTDAPLELASCKVTNARCQNEKIIYRATVAAENDKPEDAVVDDDSLKGINGGASNSSSSKLKDDVQYQNKNSISEDTIAAVKDKYIVVDYDGAYTISDEERNLAGEKPRKFRLLSDILKDLAGPCDAASAGYGDNEFSSESEDDSDDFTLDTSGRKKKGVGVTSSKSGVVSKKKRGSRKLPERSCNRPKRMKPVPVDSSRKDPELGSKRQLRKTRTDKVDLQVINKFKSFSAEIIVHGSTSGSQKVAPSSVGGGENRSGTQKNSLLSRGNKRTRGTIEDDCGRVVMELLDGSHRHFTEENSLTATHGVKDAQFVQPTIAVLKNIEADSGCAQKGIREDSPPIDNESMAALQLLRLFNSGVTTHTSSKTATSDPAIPVSTGEILSGLDDKMLSASGSIVGQSHEEINMIIGDGLPQAEQTESGTSVCVLNMNPSEFSIVTAKKHMRRVKAIQKGGKAIQK